MPIPRSLRILSMQHRSCNSRGKHSVVCNTGHLSYTKVNGMPSKEHKKQSLLLSCLMPCNQLQYEPSTLSRTSTSRSNSGNVLANHSNFHKIAILLCRYDRHIFFHSSECSRQNRLGNRETAHCSSLITGSPCVCIKQLCRPLIVAGKVDIRAPCFRIYVEVLKPMFVQQLGPKGYAGDECYNALYLF